MWTVWNPAPRAFRTIRHFPSMPARLRHRRTTDSGGQTPHSASAMRPWSPFSEVSRLPQTGRTIGRTPMAALCGLQFEGKLGTTAMRKYRSFAPPPAVQPRFSCGNRSVAVLCLEPQEPREGSQDHRKSADFRGNSRFRCSLWCRVVRGIFARCCP